jgi:hypothetical protein
VFAKTSTMAQTNIIVLVQVKTCSKKFWKKKAHLLLCMVVTLAFSFAVGKNALIALLQQIFISCRVMHALIDLRSWMSSPTSQGEVQEGQQMLQVKAGGVHGC